MQQLPRNGPPVTLLSFVSSTKRNSQWPRGTSDQGNWTLGRIAAARGLLNRVRQVAQMCILI